MFFCHQYDNKNSFRSRLRLSEWYSELSGFAQHRCRALQRLQMQNLSETQQGHDAHAQHRPTTLHPSYLSIFLLFLVVLPIPSLAADSKSGVSPQVISLPTGPGSITGLGESFEPNLNTGTATYGVKIAVSPGVHGFEPAVGLVYNSGYGNSVLGIGWSLNLEYIQRQTDKGIPAYEDTDIFTHSGSGELVPLPGNLFRAKIEGGFSKFVKLAEGWQAWRKDGTRLIFGPDTGSRKSNSLGIFAWYLEREIDTNGNEIGYLYSSDEGQLYLDEIRYSMVSETVYKSVRFVYENRPDPFTSYVSREKVVTARRLKAIEVRSEESLVRKYALAYYDTPVFSQLAAVTQYGTDGSTSLPPLTFSYSWYSTENMETVVMSNIPPVNVSPVSSNADLVDINGDSLPDLVHTDPVQGHHAFYINNGRGVWQEYPVIPDLSPGDLLAVNGVMMADMNGDGRSDLFIKGLSKFGYYKNGGGLRWTESDWVACSPNPGFSFEDSNIKLLDVNNDKLIDVMISDDYSRSYKVWLNRKSNQWSDTFDYQTWLPGGFLSFNSAAVKLGDMNGDRIQDLVFVINGYTSYFPGKGNGEFDAEVAMSGSPGGLGSLAAKLETADIDNNGLADLVLVSSGGILVWLNNGKNGFQPSILFEDTPQYHAPAAHRFADMNGDGFTDLLITDETGVNRYVYVDFNNGVHPNLLTKISNGLGRETEIHYRASTEEYLADRDNGASWSSSLPFPVQVVANVTVRDLNSGHEYQVEYHYRDGYYDGEEKEFRGFGGVRKVEHGEITAPTLLTSYTFDVGREEESRKGLVTSVASLTGNGTVTPPVGLFNRQQSTITTKSLFTGLNGEKVRFSYIGASTSTIYEKTANPVTLYQEFIQDDYGNLTKDFQYGIVDGGDFSVGDDEILTSSTYLYDTTNWILNRPLSISRIDLSGAFISLQNNFYDAKGNLIREEHSPDGTNFIPLLRNEYDSFGNIIRMTDANDHCREIVYDGLFHTFPVSESICGLGLIMSAEYDAGLGKLTGHTGFNGHSIKYLYDPLGRVNAIVKPGDTETLPSQSFVYSLGSPVSSVFTRSREQFGEPGTYDGVVYYDGLGRKLQTRSEGEDGNWVVNGALSFNDRQQPHKQWLPYFSRSSAYQPPNQSNSFVTLEYDAMMRPTKQSQPDGTFSSTSFTPLAKTVFDEEDNGTGKHADTPHTFIQDGLERLVEVQEKNGGETYVTRYSYDGLGNLVWVLDNEGNVKTMEFDGLGRKTRMDDPDKHDMHYFYDPAGNLLSTIDARGMEVIYRYDKANRLLTEEFDGSVRVRNHYGGDLAAAWPNMENSLGRLAWIEDEAGREFFSYDARGNQTVRVREAGGKIFVNRMGYDGMDRLTALTYPDMFTVDYHYNSMNLLEAVPGFISNIDYNASGLKTAFEYTNGISSYYSYDQRQRLSGLQTINRSSILQHLSYNYDGVGNITVIGDSRVSKTPEDRSRTFQYDDLYRLTWAVAPDWTRSYQYSSIGNMIFKTDAGVMTYGEGTAGPHAVTSVAGAELTYGYDLNGNISGKTPGFAYEFDHRDRMIEVNRTEDSAEISYSYDAGGNRRTKRVTVGGDTAETIYADQYTELRENSLIKQVYAGSRLVARITTPFNAAVLSGSIDPLSKEDFDVSPANGVITLDEIKAQGSDPNSLEAGGVADAQRVYYTNLESDPGLLSFSTMAEAMHLLGEGSTEPDSSVHYYIPDHLGSPAIVTDTEGAVVEESVFYPYGQDRARIGSFASEYRFTGKELDDETGLHYFEARYYDSLVGRFLSVDPLYVEKQNRIIGSSANLDPFMYVQNSPINYIDPSGMIFLMVLTEPALPTNHAAQFKPGEFRKVHGAIGVGGEIEQGRAPSGQLFQTNTADVGIGIGAGVKFGKTTPAHEITPKEGWDFSVDASAKLLGIGIKVNTIDLYSGSPNVTFSLPVGSLTVGAKRVGNEFGSSTGPNLWDVNFTEKPTTVPYAKLDAGLDVSSSFNIGTISHTKYYTKEAFNIKLNSRSSAPAGMSSMMGSNRR